MIELIVILCQSNKGQHKNSCEEFSKVPDAESRKYQIFFNQYVQSSHAYNSVS